METWIGGIPGVSDVLRTLLTLLYFALFDPPWAIFGQIGKWISWMEKLMLSSMRTECVSDRSSRIEFSQRAGKETQRNGM